MGAAPPTQHSTRKPPGFPYLQPSPRCPTGWGGRVLGQRKDAPVSSGRLVPLGTIRGGKVSLWVPSVTEIWACSWQLSGPWHRILFIHFHGASVSDASLPLLSVTLGTGTLGNYGASLLPPNDLSPSHSLLGLREERRGQEHPLLPRS